MVSTSKSHLDIGHKFGVYFESSVKGKSIILSSDKLENLLEDADKAFSYLKALKNADMVKSVVCVSIYEDDLKILQYGSI